MLNHGINTYKHGVSDNVSQKATVSVPFYVGAWPCHKAGGYTGAPQIANSYAEAVKFGGYSDEWRDASGAPKWTLCEAMYSHFKIFGIAPAIFYNVFDPATHKTAVSPASVAVNEHVAKLPSDAIIDSSLSVVNGEDTLVKGTDFKAYYDEASDSCIVELLEGDNYDAESLTIGYNKVDLTAITSTTIITALESIENCKGGIGLVPDLVCCPGWSQTPAVAAVMAEKAANINGLFRGKAVVDLDTSSSGADNYSDVLTYKSANAYTDENMIVCWPLFVVGDKTFDASVIACGKIAEIDIANGNFPSESPSNKAIPITGCVNKAGEEITLTVQQADTVSYSAGVLTALNFGGWTLWGNYTGCATETDDVSKRFISTSRTMDFLGNRFIEMFWQYLDRPLSRVLIDAIVNSFNTYLNGLAHDGKIIGGEIKYVESNNSAEDLLDGKFRLDCVEASPTPAQQINLYTEFSADMLVESFTAKE